MHTYLFNTYIKIFGLEHTSTATSYNNLGSLYKDMGKIEQAEEYYLRCLKINEKVD
jgi:hypothetical protein